jgi:hypothetical protein
MMLVFLYKNNEKIQILENDFCVCCIKCLFLVLNTDH